MAVQKSRVTRSKRGMRRAHDHLTNPSLTTNAMGETHRRHHVSPKGVYKDRQVINESVTIDEDDSEQE